MAEKHRLLPDYELNPGTKVHLDLPVAETAAGPVTVPMTVVCGTGEGPTLAVTAACHPGEYNGVLASVLLAKETEPADLAGTLAVVHAQNIFGLALKAGHKSPVDGVNFGHAFPVPGQVVEDPGAVSHQSRSVSHRIAETIFHQVVLASDAVIDLHGGEFFETLPPNIEYLPIGRPDIDERTRAFARTFGIPVLWEVPAGTIPEMPAYPGRGSAVLEAAHYGIPGVFFEVGGEGKVEEDLVRLTVDGMKSAMRGMGMLSGHPIAVRHRVLVGGHVLFAARGGISRPAVVAGQEVAAGEYLGHIMDLRGAVVEEFHAPQAAVLTNVVVRGAANPGDMLYVLGNTVD